MTEKDVQSIQQHHITVDAFSLTHWSRVTHICFSKLTITGSDNGWSPGRRQAIVWNNVGILLIRTLWTHFWWNIKRNSYIFFQENALKNIVCEMAAILSRLNVLSDHRLCFDQQSALCALFANVETMQSPEGGYNDAERVLVGCCHNVSIQQLHHWS